MAARKRKTPPEETAIIPQNGPFGSSASDDVAAIVANVLGGMSLKMAAAQCKISQKKLTDALLLGQTEIASREAGGTPNPLCEPYVTLVMDTAKATTEIYSEALSAFRQAIRGNETRKITTRQQLVLEKDEQGVTHHRKVTLREESVTISPGDWKAAERWLQRIEPEEWSPQQEYIIRHRYEDVLKGIAEGDIDIDVVAGEFGEQAATTFARLAESYTPSNVQNVEFQEIDQE